MNNSTSDRQAARVSAVNVTDNMLTVDLADGRILSVPLAWYPRLLHGMPEERQNWRLIGDGAGIHWPDLDEDISVEALVSGRCSEEDQRSLQRWLEGRTAAKEPTASAEERTAIPSPETREGLLCSIRTAASQSGRSKLTYADFRRITGVPRCRVLKYFDSWTEACHSAGVKPGEACASNIKGRPSKGKDHAGSELKRIAEKLGVKTFSKREFNAQKPDVTAQTVAKLWGGWDKALEAAGLERHPLFYAEIPLTELANEFLSVCEELGQVPTAWQLSRRSKHSMNTFTRKFGSFSDFKVRAIEHLLSTGEFADETRVMLETHLNSLKRETESKSDAPAPHARGRHLGFRAFAFAPTYEAEVVSLFSSVADELGFEIVAQRPAFPDCEARRLYDGRRARYRKCLIEFEFKSSDYQKHHHPVKGCALIVCWEHDWTECPLEVLELSSRIKRLPGWK